MNNNNDLGKMPVAIKKNIENRKSIKKESKETAATNNPRNKSKNSKKSQV